MAKKPKIPPDMPDLEDYISDLQRRAEELADGDMLFRESDDMPDRVRRQFWEQVVAFEEAPQIAPFDLLVRGGMELPEPEALDDAQLGPKLWEVIRGMAMLRHFLYSTDHLSDRELYEALWRDILRQEVPDMPVDMDSAWHIDLLGSGSEEDSQLYLRYYADEDYRRDWAKDWPDDPMPPSEKPPFDRDRLLPKRNEPGWGHAGRPS